jgi:hypothetical protein
MHATHAVHLMLILILFKFWNFFMLWVHACQPSAEFSINTEIILPITVACRSKV